MSSARRIALRNETTTISKNNSIPHQVKAIKRNSVYNKASTKGPRRIIDPRDAKDTKLNEMQTKNSRRASVHCSPSAQPRAKDFNKKLFTRRQSAPTISTSVSLDDDFVSRNSPELTKQEKIMLANFRLHKLDDGENDIKQYCDYSENCKESIKNKRRVSFLPAFEEPALSTLKEEDEINN